MVSKLLLVTQKQSTFAGMLPVIEKMGGSIDWAASGQQSLQIIDQQAFDAIIVDEKIEDMTGLALIEKIVAINPMVNSALVSSLGKEDYHEASEGLGILMQLPTKPEKSDGERLMSHLSQILGFTSQTTK